MYYMMLWQGDKNYNLQGLGYTVISGDQRKIKCKQVDDNHVIKGDH